MSWMFSATPQELLIVISLTPLGILTFRDDCDTYPEP